MIIGLQIIAIIFALLMIYFSSLNYKRAEINGIEYFSWLTIWVVTIFIVIFPEMLRTFASAFLITRLFDLMVVAALMIIFVMVSKSYVRTKKFERKLNHLIDEIAKKK